VTEVSCASENHGNPVFISSGNDFFIAHTAAWLNGAAGATIHYDV
jgi:hypothetical protein